MPIRQRDVTADEVDDARAALQAAKASGDHDAIGHAMDVLAVLRAAHREQHIDPGLRADGLAIRTVQDGFVVVKSGEQLVVMLPEEG